jgi:hypothetical protein
MTTSRILLLTCFLTTTACGDDDGSSSATGFAELSWEIRDEATNDPEACGGGDIVRVTLAGVVTEFDCTVSRGTTRAIDDGTHTATVELIDAGGNVRSTTSFSVTIGNGTTTDMGLVQFLVD